MKKSHPFIFFICTLFICCIIGIWIFFLFVPVITEEKGSVYYLRPGTSKKMLLADFAQQDIIRYPTLFSIYLYPQVKVHLKTGEYFFPKGSTLFSIWKQITTGKGLVYHPFTIIPGWSFKQLRQELSHTVGLRHRITSLNDKQVMERIGYATLAPEGEFFPETYYYTKGLSDLVILKKAFKLMQNKIGVAWKNRALALPYKNPYEALIAASLIEKEAHLSSERPIIAGVLVNRLRHDMPLQFDPTVIYGMGERYQGKIHKDNLLENTAYNTYIHKGLPPTPIAMPSMASMEAAMHPQKNDYFYFVAKGDGSHHFSKTLVEHQSAVAEIIPTLKHHTQFFNHSKIRQYLNPWLQQRLIEISAT